jgi:hypothetical protein
VCRTETARGAAFATGLIGSVVAEVLGGDEGPRLIGQQAGGLGLHGQNAEGWAQVRPQGRQVQALHPVAVRAGVQARNNILAASFGRQEEVDRGGGRVWAHATACHHPVQDGKPPRVGASQEGPSLQAIAGDDDRMAPAAEGRFEHTTADHIAVRNEELQAGYLPAAPHPQALTPLARVNAAARGTVPCVPTVRSLLS